MAVECGIVAETRGNMVRVEASAVDMCASCASRGSCHSIMGDKTRSLWIRNTLDASMGDRVEFAVRESAVVGLSALFYLMPVALMILGVLAGHRLRFFGLDSELAAAILGSGGFLLSMAAIKAASLFIQRRASYQPVLLKIIERI